MYNYTFYHALYSVRVSISHYVLHIAMFLLLIEYSSKYKSYASEPYLPGHSLVSCTVVLNTSIIVSTVGQFVPNLGCHLDGVGLNVPSP